MTPPPNAARLASWIGTWSRPPDRPSQVALAIGALLVVLALSPNGPHWLGSLLDVPALNDVRRRRRFLMLASFVAAFLSLGYIAFYLRGGPRAAEASGYWLQGRALSHGLLAWTAPDPTASFRARDLVLRGADRLSGVFPPGFPLLLAVGCLVGAPMLVGPVLAAVIALSTWRLAHEVAAAPRSLAPGDAGRPFGRGAEAEAVARTAVALSIVSAALRYHTADAIPYGACAAAVALALAAALWARRTGVARRFVGAGFAAGFLAAAAPSAALAVGAVVFALAAGSPQRARSLAWVVVGATPGAILLLAANHAATGHSFVFPLATVGGAWLRDPPSGPPPHRVLSLLVAWRRHALDVANFEPLLLLAILAVVGRPRRGAVVLAAMVVVGHVAIQALASGTGSPPERQGNALVCMLPIEHVLIAFGLARLFPRALAQACLGALGLSIVGFGVHASFVHEALAGGDLARPRFEPDVLREANVTNGLLFFDDDRGYELASDPGVAASHGVEAVRKLGDDHDRLLYDALGHPPTHRYATTSGSAAAVLWMPPSSLPDSWRFEAENEWPSGFESLGRSEIAEQVDPCVSGGRVVRLTPAGVDGRTTLALPLPHPGAPGEKRTWTITPRIVEQASGGEGDLALVSRPGEAPLAEWAWSDTARGCVDLPPHTLEMPAQASAWLVLHAKGGPVLFDRTTVVSR